jgi:glycosyltransferase involved in cell wall biosynthesis
MLRPAVSVVIPTFKHRDFILHTLDSVFKQTMRDYEVVVVNDGSPDDTHEILRPLIETNRVRYFQQTNQGPSEARNHGIREARGRYIALLDDDDIWPPDKLEWQVGFLDEHPDVGVVGGTLQIVDDRGAEIRKGRHHSAITHQTLFAGNPFHSPGQTLIRATILAQLGGMNVAIWGADDWDLWFRIAREFKIVMQDRLALYYRVHAGNASKQSARLLRGCCATIERHLRDEPAVERNRFRAQSHGAIYSGLGSDLVTSAKGQLRSGSIISAIRSFAGLYPLTSSLLFEPDVRSEFLSDLRWR